WLPHQLHDFRDRHPDPDLHNYSARNQLPWLHRNHNRDGCGRHCAVVHHDQQEWNRSSRSDSRDLLVVQHHHTRLGPMRYLRGTHYPFPTRRSSDLWLPHQLHHFLVRLPDPDLHNYAAGNQLPWIDRDHYRDGLWWHWAVV